MNQITRKSIPNVTADQLLPGDHVSTLHLESGGIEHVNQLVDYGRNTAKATLVKYKKNGNEKRLPANTTFTVLRERTAEEQAQWEADQLVKMVDKARELVAKEIVDPQARVTKLRNELVQKLQQSSQLSSMLRHYTPRIAEAEAVAGFWFNVKNVLTHNPDADPIAVVLYCIECATEEVLHQFRGRSTCPYSNAIEANKRDALADLVSGRGFNDAVSTCRYAAEQAGITPLTREA